MRQTAQSDPLLRGRVRSIFIMPASLQQLELRLRGRATDPEDEIQRRMQVAIEEMKQSVLYDYSILSATRDEDFAQLDAIYQASQT